MDREKKFAKNTLIISIGTLCTKLISFLLLPLYTGLLSTSEYGTVEIITTITSLVVPILNLQIDQAIFRLLVDYRNDNNSIKSYISTTLLFYIVTTLVYIILYIPILFVVKKEYMLLIFLSIIFNSLSGILLQISRGLGKTVQYSVSSFIIALSTIISNIIFLVGLKYKVDGMIMGTVFGNIIGVLYLCIALKIWKLFDIKCFSIKCLKELLKYSVPLVPNSISWWIFSASDRFIIAGTLGLAATGILSVSYKFASAYIIIYNIFNTSMTETVAEHINDIDISKFYSKILTSVFKIFVLINIAVLIMMPFTFNLLVNINYNDAYYIIPITMIASLLQVVVGMLGTVYAAKHNTKSLANTAIVSAIVNLLTDLLLVKYIGIYAASVSTLISYIVLLIYRYIDVNKKYFKININKKDLIMSISLFFISMVYYYINTIIIRYICVIIVLIMSIIYLKKDLISIIKFIICKRKGE